MGAVSEAKSYCAIAALQGEPRPVGRGSLAATRVQAGASYFLALCKQYPVRANLLNLQP